MSGVADDLYGTAPLSFLLVTIKLIVLIMQQPETPLELAITSYTSQLHIPPEDQSSIRQIAEDFDVSRTTLSNRLRGVTQSRSRAFTHHQALSHDEEASLVEYIRLSSLLGHPPPPYMVYEVADEIVFNSKRSFSPLTLAYALPHHIYRLTHAHSITQPATPCWSSGWTITCVEPQ